jgi:hypothetical protein
MIFLKFAQCLKPAYRFAAALGLCSTAFVALPVLATPVLPVPAQKQTSMTQYSHQTVVQVGDRKVDTYSNRQSTYTREMSSEMSSEMVGTAPVSLLPLRSEVIYPVAAGGRMVEAPIEQLAQYRKAIANRHAARRAQMQQRSGGLR